MIINLLPKPEHIWVKVALLIIKPGRQVQTGTVLGKAGCTVTPAFTTMFTSYLKSALQPAKARQMFAVLALHELKVKPETTHGSKGVHRTAGTAHSTFLNAQDRPGGGV